MKKINLSKHLIKVFCVFLTFIVISCSKENIIIEESIDLRSKITESDASKMSDLQIEEIITGKKAFRKIVELSDKDNRQTIKVEVGSFDKEVFDESIKAFTLSLLKKDFTLNTQGNPTDNLKDKAKPSKPLTSNTFYVEIVEHSNIELKNEFMLQISYKEPSLKNAKIANGGVNVVVPSNEWPTSAKLGRDPFGPGGNVSFTKQTKRRWYNSWDHYYNGPLFLPDLRNWYYSYEEYYKVRFLMTYEQNGSYTAAFFY